MLRMKKLLLTLSASTIAATILVAPAVHAATANPDDLVNTEAMFTIAPGDGSEDIELQFGSDASDHILMYNFTNGRFEFGNDLYVNGGLEVQNDIDQDGNTFTLDADNTGAGANVSIVAEQGSDSDGVLRYNATTNEWEISNDGGSYYAVSTSNDIDSITGVDSNTFTVDQDDTGGDVSLIFGTTLAENLKWDSANSRFVLSDDLFLDGGLTLNGDLDFDQNQAVDMVLHQGTSFPAGPVEGQTFYRTDSDTMYIYDGSNWVAMADAPGALSIFMAPQYANATYAKDGSNNVGRLLYNFDAVNVENYYRWKTRKSAMQDYDIKVRIQVPEDFSSWDSTTPIEFKYRTNTTNSADNVIDFSMQDTADAAVTMTNNTGLVSSTAGQWVTSTNMTIGGSPTFNAGDWFTVTIKMSATQNHPADVGSLVFNYNR